MAVARCDGRVENSWEADCLAPPRSIELIDLGGLNMHRTPSAGGLAVRLVRGAVLYVGCDDPTTAAPGNESAPPVHNSTGTAGSGHSGLTASTSVDAPLPPAAKEPSVDEQVSTSRQPDVTDPVTFAPGVTSHAGTAPFVGHSFFRKQDQMSISALGGARRMSRAL